MSKEKTKKELKYTWMDNLIKNFPKDFKFKPFATYNKGDEIECYWNEQICRGHWINNQITLMIGEETGEIVGVIISGVKNLLKGK